MNEQPHQEGSTEPQEREPILKRDSPSTLKKALHSVKDFVVFVAIAFAIVLPIRVFIAQPFIVDGKSMSPTFETSQYLIVDQLSYRFSEPQRGDVVIFRFPFDTSRFFIKRIIGLPGETVTLDNQEVRITKINGETITLDESQIVYQKNDNITITLNDTQYYVMGDNRLQSHDSRAWGPLEEEYIVGRALLRLFPIGEFDIMPGSIDTFNNQ